MLTEHPAINSLKPFFTVSLIKALTSIGKGQYKIGLPALEHYAFDIYKRTTEIQNSLSKIELSIEYLSQIDYPSSRFKFTEHYSYHAERLIIEVFSIHDRCWSLIGSSLHLGKKDIEKIGSKQIIQKKVKAFPSIASSLKRIEAITKPYRAIRNDIAHNKSYSNTALSYISQCESGVLNKEIELLMEKIDFKNKLNNETTETFKALNISLNKSIIDLLDNLAPLYIKISTK